jgi:tRNA pseudouridine55 synthase
VIVPVDKPAGPTSHDVVASARRALGTRRVGHTGTLDPFATGLLLLCVGPATRLAQFLTGLPKRYVAGVRLGARTTTDDLEGEIEATSEAWRELSRARLDDALARFRGPIRQAPPRFSAKKVGGESAHYRARRGEDVQLASVDVEVLALDVLSFDPPDLELAVECSSGTYVRALARDLGETLATGAHLRSLRRTAIGSFDVDRAIAVEALRDPAEVERALITPADALAHLPAVQVGAAEVARLARGQAIPLAGAGDAGGSGTVAVIRDHELVAVAEREGGWVRPRKVFVGADA